MTLIVATPNGRMARYQTREDTSDAALVYGIVEADEYNFRGQTFTGWAVDIGAHIGTVAVALALDNPDLCVVAVEALPENAAVLTANVVANALSPRVFVENAAGGAPGETSVDITYGWAKAQNQPDGYMHDNRFIGGMVGANETSLVAHCDAVSLTSLMAKYGIDEIALLKLDCEGCEWFVLTDPAVSKVRYIKGEMHAGRHGGRERLLELLSPTHEVRWLDENLVVGHFEATRR